MRKSTLFCFILISSFFYSCSVVKGSFHYTRGTDCFEKGEYEEARRHLEKSVMAYPDFANAQTNLALAYMKTGEGEKAWPHFRKACILNPDNPNCANLVSYWGHLKDFYGIQKGSHKDLIIQSVGEPDLTMQKNDEITCLLYGRIVVYLVDGKFDCDELLERKGP